MLLASTVLLAMLVALGLVERRARDRAHARLPIRIHVNGTRGKSTVTRLIAGALREAGIRTIAKTTGTAPRLILPDGSERPIRRLAPASVGEQLRILRATSRLGAQALVVECMAIDPELQAVSEREMVRATVAVFTNARLDHGEVMGTTPDEVGQALSATVPQGGVVVIGSPEGTDPITRAAGTRGCRVVRARTDAADLAGVEPWMADNVATALAVTRELGVDDDVARRGMLTATPDPGACTQGLIEGPRRTARWIDATAANDPASLARLLGPRVDPIRFVFHHRADRPFRLRQFAQDPPWAHAGDTVIVTGERPDWATWRALRASLGASRVGYRSRASLAAGLRLDRDVTGAAPTIVFCGNTKGFDRQAALAALAEA